MTATIPLAIAVPGCFVCQQVEGDAVTAVRLKRMGICNGRHIHVVQSGDPMILQVVGARIGISRQLAAHVVVSPVAGHAIKPGASSASEAVEP